MAQKLHLRNFSNAKGRCEHPFPHLRNTAPYQRENKIMKTLNRLTTDDDLKLSMAGNQLSDCANRGLRQQAEQSVCTTKESERDSRGPTHGKHAVWSPSTAEGRWSGFGPYYAMFPVEFARQVVEQYCPPGGAVLDPFCGRGTVPFVALATGRTALACDINPVAWIFAKTKTDPYPDAKRLMRRACAIQASVTDADRTPVNEFQELAWSQDVLGFLNSARRQLNWRQSQIDRTLMATLLVHLHSKLGEGLSNQMRQSKAMAPEYSVRWWKERAMLPPNIDVLGMLKEKLSWRYKKGIVSPREGSHRPAIKLGDNREALQRRGGPFSADLILTSPPYYGVTNYRYDNWIRLWMLREGPALPASDAWARHQNQDEYRELIRNTFKQCKSKAAAGVIVYVRTDARKFTLQTTIDTLREVWPNKNLYYAFDGFKKPTQTALFGDKAQKPGEVDLLILSSGQHAPKDMKLLALGVYPKLI
jgi:DNA modification methylase